MEKNFRICKYRVAVSITKEQPAQDEAPIAFPNVQIKEEQMDRAQTLLETINSWINNCDQKSGILLSGIGIVSAVLFSTDFMTTRVELLVEEFKEWYSGCPDFSMPVHHILAAVFMLLTIVALAFTFAFLLGSLTANLKEKKKNSSKTRCRIADSLLFYMTIRGKNYTDFRNETVGLTDEKYLEEILSQVHINSEICTRKFVRYKHALRAFAWCLVSLAIMLVLLSWITISR